jgi:hypothetical protein
MVFEKVVQGDSVMEPWYAVGCGLILTWCGYMLGKPVGFRQGIESSLEYMAMIGAIKITEVDGEEHITLPDNVKIDEINRK